MRVERDFRKEVSAVHSTCQERRSVEIHAPDSGDRSGLETHKREKRSVSKKNVQNEKGRWLRGQNPGTPIFKVTQNREPDEEEGTETPRTKNPIQDTHKGLNDFSSISQSC